MRLEATRPVAASPSDWNFWTDIRANEIDKSRANCYGPVQIFSCDNCSWRALFPHRQMTWKSQSRHQLQSCPTCSHHRPLGIRSLDQLRGSHAACSPGTRRESPICTDYVSSSNLARMLWWATLCVPSWGATGPLPSLPSLPTLPSRVSRYKYDVKCHSH
jgi:hypothetical protein